uniref:CCHC-type domain-containing protein n=1 Tax=Strongyloides papillosus TaxID=174720 RepID=A0A0N5BIS5_STREA
MDKLDQKNLGPNGTKSLTFFMDSGDRDPTALAVESFFRINLAIIKSLYPEVEEREAIREELKDHFEILLFHPIGNSLYSCFRKWRTVSPKCPFDFLLKAVETEYDIYVRNNFNLHSMKDWKQGVDEPVREYNKRYRERLAELYPDFENMPYRRANEKSERTNSLRMEVVRNYIAGLKDELIYMMSVFNSSDKCLETVMINAESYENEWIEMKERIKEEENKREYYRHLSSSVDSHKGKDKLECHNCGKYGHFKRECNERLAECKFCTKRGHLIQFCYRRRSSLIGISKSDTPRKFVALVLARNCHVIDC